MEKTPKSGFYHFLIHLLLIGSVYKVAGSESGKKILASDDNIFSTNQNKNAHPPTILLRRMKRDEGIIGNRDANEDKGAEIGTVVQNHTLEIIGLKKELKILQDELRKLVKQNEEELAPIKARYFRDPQENTQLHLAAQRGDEQAIRNLIRLGADVNARNDNSETPIIQAVASNVDANTTLKIIKYLIENEADASAADSGGQTFFHKFASRESPPTSAQFHDIAGYLVGKHLSNLFNLQDKLHGSTPLMLAVVNNVDLKPMTLSLLHENRVDFKSLDKNGKSVLSYAAEGNSTDNLVRSLVNLGPFNLAEAIVKSDEEMVKLLVRFGADMNKPSDTDIKSPFGLVRTYSGTPLHVAANSRNMSFALSIIKFLISSGADVYAKDEKKDTFLHTLLLGSGNNVYGYTPISQEEFEDLAAFLISRNLSELFNTPGNFDMGTTPFQLAVRNWDIENATLAMLKENGVDFNAVNNGGCSVVCFAAGRPLKFIMKLVNFGADLMFLDNTNTSMLHRAAAKRNVELVEFFLEKGMDVNAQNEEGETPLHLAMSPDNNVFETVQILMRNGANCEIPEKRGYTPRDYLSSASWLYRPWRNVKDKIATCFNSGKAC